MSGADDSRTDRTTSGMARWLKVALIAVVIAIVVVLLFTTVFPWVEQRLENPAIGTLHLLRPPR